MWPLSPKSSVALKLQPSHPHCVCRARWLGLTLLGVGACSCPTGFQAVAVHMQGGGATLTISLPQLPGMGSLLTCLLERGPFSSTRRQANRAGSVSPARTRGTVVYVSAGVSASALCGPSLLSCPCLSSQTVFPQCAPHPVGGHVVSIPVNSDYHMRSHGDSLPSGRTLNPSDLCPLSSF